VGAAHGVQVATEPGTPVGYYGVPAIHGPHWKWLIIGYFFLGGVSGGAAALGGAARLFGGRDSAAVARTASYVSFVALAPCPLLLILDLRRPKRFLNMIRTVRPSSPMSVGTWGLMLFSLLSLVAVGRQLRSDITRKGDPGDEVMTEAGGNALAVIWGVSGFFVAGYTGVLLAATAVPLWSKRPGLLGPLFLSSALASGAAAIAAVMSVLGDGDNADEHAIQRLETVCSVTEGALLVSWICALGPTAKPITAGRLGALVTHGIGGGGIALPLLVAALRQQRPHERRRAATFIAAALTLAGGFALRYAVVEGGRRSANDAGATFEMTG
jgi:formate-dependent nitrite reductase membrane component NrfD